MTRRNPPARYTLPANPTPTDSLCYRVEVPNDPMHLAAFMGQMKALGSAYVWHNDDAHTALDAAAAWKPVFDKIALDPDPCGINPPSILCIEGSFADSTYGFVPQIAAPCSPSYNIGEGFASCFTGIPALGDYLLVERVFDQETFIRRFKITFGGIPATTFTVQVEFLFHTANVFSATQTFVGGGTFEMELDVNQQADVMLITMLDSNLVHLTDLKLFTWQLCYSGDFPLADNVTASFNHFFDFTLSDYGFLPLIAGTTWVAGQGWVGSRIDVNNFSDQIYKTFPTRPITHAEYTVVNDGCGGAGCQANIWGLLGGADSFYNNYAGMFGSQVVFFDGSADSDQIRMRANCGNGCTTSIITQARIIGLGIDPF